MRADLGFIRPPAAESSTGRPFIRPQCKGELVVVWHRWGAVQGWGCGIPGGFWKVSQQDSLMDEMSVGGTESCQGHSEDKIS